MEKDIFTTTQRLNLLDFFGCCILMKINARSNKLRLSGRVERLSILIERGAYVELVNALTSMKAESVASGHELVDSAILLSTACEQSAKATQTQGAQYTNTLRHHCALTDKLRELCLSLDVSAEGDEGGAVDGQRSNDNSVDLASDLVASGEASSVSDPTPPAADPAPTMSIYLLGPFRVCVDGAFIRDWPNGKSKMVFKYLAAHRDRPIAKERLMETFWPNSCPEAARNSLNVAIYNVRQALRQRTAPCPYVIYADDKYSLNDEIGIWVDADEFLRHWQSAQNFENRGDVGNSMREWQTADALYDGDFLEEDRFEDWIVPLREDLRDKYRRALIKLNDHHLEQGNDEQAIEVGQKLIRLDPCDEAAHRQLMTCYWRTGQPHLAVRQYNRCIEALTRELDVDPDPSTIELFDKIRQRVKV